MDKSPAATVLLPTTFEDVNIVLRAEAARDPYFIDRAPLLQAHYLLRLATAKLAEANREYLRLLQRQTEKNTSKSNRGKA